MIVIYQISTGKILNYIKYEGVEKPSLTRTVATHNISIEDLEVKKWNKTDPQEVDFKDSINDLTELEDF